MKDITLELIKNILAVDETVTKGKADDILCVYAGTVHKLKTSTSDQRQGSNENP